MALRSSTVTVGTAPTALASDVDAGSNPSRDLMVHNPGPATIWVGDSNVTPEVGMPVAAGGSLAFDTIMTADIPHAATESDQVVVRVLEVGV